MEDRRRGDSVDLEARESVARERVSLMGWGSVMCGGSGGIC